MGELLKGVTQASTLKPPRIVIHGKPGVGKTSFAADADDGIIMPLEDGLGILSVTHFERDQVRTFDGVIAALAELAQEDHPYKVLTIDTIDKMEPMVWQKTCESGGKNHIEDFGYGKGYTKADEHWIRFFHALDHLRKHREMVTIILCHNEGKMIEDPVIGTYTQFCPKLHKRANALLYEWADIVGYLDTERAAVDKGEEGSKRTTRTSRSTGARILYLEDRGAFVAKNRYGMESEIEIPRSHPYQAFRKRLAAAVSGTVAAEGEGAAV